MDFNWLSLSDYSAVVDVRTPAEFAEDHVPEAINLPVLANDERAVVGKRYREDQFAGRRMGMGMVAASLSRMASEELADKGPQWRPLVYCWRGGMRSGSVVEAMRKVGWQATALPGGYKAYRSHVRDRLARLPQAIDWHVLCGPTGAGKTLLLAALARQGAQVVELEGLANHRGSLFGGRGAQPTQKSFESGLLVALERLDPTRPAFIESESHAIGKVRVPHTLLAGMHAGKVVLVEAELAARARLTVRDYTDFDDPQQFAAVVAKLSRYVAKATIERWHGLHRARRLQELAESLLAEYYDHKYMGSLRNHYDLSTVHAKVTVTPVDGASLAAAARVILAQGDAFC